MNIAVFIKSTTFHKGYGGMETQNKLLCEGLTSRGHKITVFSPQKELNIETTSENEVVYKFVPCVYKNFSWFYANNENSWLNKSFTVFSEIHNKEPFDIVISQSSGGLGIIKNKKLLNVKILAISHGTKIGEVQTRLNSLSGVKDFFRFVLDTPHVLRAFFGTQREFIHGADKIVAVSNAVKSALIDETYVQDNKIVVINNGIDGTRFAKIQKPESTELPVKLIYIGQILRSKGLFILLEALGKIDKTKYILNVYGDGVDLIDLKAYVKKLNLEQNIIFHGKVAYDEVPECFALNDIFILPSIRLEGFPMTLAEAMFAGLPTIASDIGGISDGIDNEKTGILVKPYDIKELTNKTELLVSNPILRNVYGRNAKMKAETELSLNTMIDNYEKVLNNL